MCIHLKKVNLEDSEKVHEMQKQGFKALLEKYKDYDTNPGAKTLEKVKWRFTLDNIDQYFIFLCNIAIGYFRVHRIDEVTCRLSQMFILPEYQVNGYAQTAITQAELLYPAVEKWNLDKLLLVQAPNIIFKNNFLMTA